MSEPRRIQLSRKKGWRLPENTVVVARPTKWGNPYRVDNAAMLHPEHRRNAAQSAVDAYRGWLMWEQPQPRLVMKDPPRITDIIAALRGKNLACWCPPDQACHADVLLKIANAGAAESPPSDVVTDQGEK
ncbi:MAG: DUF4326 domain-containing protein [Hyphomonadaceae bacterium]|nr:DUF4326 domain-containing protein [Hyphomonadaceae bacterium]